MTQLAQVGRTWRRFSVTPPGIFQAVSAYSTWGEVHVGRGGGVKVGWVGGGGGEGRGGKGEKL